MRNITKLKLIFLKSNKLTSLPKNLFRNNSQLEAIDVAHNRLQIINLSLIPNPKLKNLLFSDNEIYAIDPLIFHSKDELRNCLFKNNVCVDQEFRDLVKGNFFSDLFTDSSQIFLIKDNLQGMKVELQNCFINFTD
jgi:hypothetical protein